MKKQYLKENHGSFESDDAEMSFFNITPIEPINYIFLWFFTVPFFALIVPLGILNAFSGTGGDIGNFYLWVIVFSSCISYGVFLGCYYLERKFFKIHGHNPTKLFTGFVIIRNILLLTQILPYVLFVYWVMIPVVGLFVLMYILLFLQSISFFTHGERLQ